jgi:hypothetical protein
MRSRPAGPGNFECKLAANQQLGMTSDMYSQRVCAAAPSFRETLFFHLQAPVRLVQRYSELVRSRGKRILKMQWLALLLRRQVH